MQKILQGKQGPINTITLDKHLICEHDFANWILMDRQCVAWSDAAWFQLFQDDGRVQCDADSMSQ